MADRDCVRERPLWRSQIDWKNARVSHRHTYTHTTVKAGDWLAEVTVKAVSTVSSVIVYRVAMLYRMLIF